MSHPPSSPPQRPSTRERTCPAEAGTRPRDEPSRLDLRADWCVDRLLPALTAALCLAMAASWVPHYLTWPWWPDLDTNAAMALAWSEGELPYRDLTAFAFPGQMLLFRALIAAFGPGKTWPIYALDAAMVLGLGLLLVLWSRRHFDRAWPGLVGAAALLAYHAGLNFSLVAQRDWQATSLIAVALLVPGLRPGRWGLVASALATAAALTFRPHVVVFGPALLMAVAQSGRDRPLPTIARWVLVVAGGLVVAFLPLILQGIFDDFLRGIRLAGYGSRYSRATPLGMAAGVVRQAAELRWLAAPLVVAVLAWSGGEGVRREARVWLLAAVGVVFYKPMHPFPHDYLDHPRWVVWSVLLAIAAAIVVLRPGLTGRVRLAAGLALLAAAVPAKPEFCNPRAALAAAAAAGRAGESPSIAPPGYAHHMTAYQAELYSWEDYRGALDHLRDGLGPRTGVANLLGYQLAVVGASGRLPVFRNESGLLWKSQVGWGDQVFIDRLAAEPDSVVVWSPGRAGPEPELVSPAIVGAVRHWYEPAERFGDIEVWRRKPGSEARGDGGRGGRGYPGPG